jgi:hypothetical protein
MVELKPGLVHEQVRAFYFENFFGFTVQGKPFEKGHRKFGGRQKGVENRFTTSAKEAFQFAFDELGGWEGLFRWAKKNEQNRTWFYRLYARLIPVDIQSKGESIAQYIARIDSQGRIVTSQSLPETDGGNLQSSEILPN